MGEALIDPIRRRSVAPVTCDAGGHVCYATLDGSINQTATLVRTGVIRGQQQTLRRYESHPICTDI